MIRYMHMIFFLYIYKFVVRKPFYASGV